MARQTGVSEVQLGKIERGEIAKPHQRTWSLIAAGLGVSVSEIQRRCAVVNRLEALITQEIFAVSQRAEPSPPAKGTQEEGDRHRSTPREPSIFGDFDNFSR